MNNNNTKTPSHHQQQQQQQQQPVDLVIRFTAAIPDAIIRIPSASLTSPLSLKLQIRTHLPNSYASNRLRLISAGKVLDDKTALSKCVNIPAPPPRATTTTRKKQDDNPKAKAKAPAEDDHVSRVYIHCSIGDTLSPDALEREAQDAQAADNALLLLQTQHATTTTPSATTTTTASNTSSHATATVTSTPQGFDRLLSTGFSPADIANLRAQFMAIQAHTHTPDTMPTGSTLRALEERWLENDSTTEGGAAAAGQTITDDENGGLQDMLWGNVMGFFWPVAAACWLMREEGVWTRRMQISVLSGVLVNLTFGFLRLTS
jgi:hypothetical protein